MVIGASVFTCGNLGPTWYICVAVKNKVLIYELNRTKVRYEKKKVSSVWTGVSNVMLFAQAHPTMMNHHTSVIRL